MKKMIFALALTFLTTAFAHAETELACWNIFAKRGSPPILKAQIGEGNTLNVSLNLQDEYFISYIYNEPIVSSDNHGNAVEIGRQTGTLFQPEANLAPTLIGTRNPTYKGDNSYSFVFAHYTYETKTYKNNGDLDAKLILPTDLSSEFLKNFRIRNPNERSNAVVILRPPSEADQLGSSYLRMYCVSK